MARESLSGDIEFERKSYGAELFRDNRDENIKLTKHEVEELAEKLD